MCCFSGDVKWVGSTRIFARDAGDGARQLLAYSMSFEATSELAMVLPLATAVGAGDDAVRFIDLSGYPTFFDDLDRAFPRPQARALSRGLAPASLDLAAKLVVHEVGHLEASFVPSVSDFARLDERFRLPKNAWDKLPVHRTYGFVVVKLAKSASKQNVHPIAFEFPRRDTSRLFFPTLHIHDGNVHKTAAFDHSLYAQLAIDRPSAMNEGWMPSMAPIAPFVEESRAKGLVVAAKQAYKRTIVGGATNDDTWF